MKVLVPRYATASGWGVEQDPDGYLCATSPCCGYHTCTNAAFSVVCVLCDGVLVPPHVSYKNAFINRMDPSAVSSYHIRSWVSKIIGIPMSRIEVCVGGKWW